MVERSENPYRYCHCVLVCFDMIATESNSRITWVKFSKAKAVMSSLQGYVDRKFEALIVLSS
jgi:hypothetical protein